MTIDKVSQARTKLLLDSPWFGALSLRLHVEATEQCKTMQTDGTRLRYNPAFVDSIPEAELVGVVAHEVMHCALLHPYRIGSRELKRWNQACDYAINQLLTDQGFALPEGVLLDPQYAGMSAEQIYALLERDNEEQQQGGGGQGQGQGQGDDEQPEQPGQIAAPGQLGGGEGDEQGEAPAAMTATDWQIATEQATAIAKKAGRMPGDADRAVKASRETNTNWREILRRFIEQTVPSDYSWMQPNRRYVASGVYLPGTVRENMPRLKVAIDTSGSITAELLQIFACELTQIMHEARPESVDVYYCDTRVQHVETFTPDDPAIKLSAIGGGGTEFQPVFDRIADEGEAPAALIYFTDLEGPAPKEPGYPVLWITSECSSRDGFFGETVRLSKWE